MLTALISALTGILSGVVPDVMKEIRDTRNHTREVEFVKLQNEIALKREEAQLEGKIREAEAGLMAEEMRAFRETLGAIIESQSKPTGIKWIDGLNSVVRPVTAVLMMVLFFWTATVFVEGVLQQWQAGAIKDQMTVANMIWGSMIGEATSAVLGFLFGYRSTIKRSVR